MEDLQGLVMDSISQSEGGDSYVCDLCDKGFEQVGQLNRHKKVHGELTSFNCFCSKIFLSQKALDDHSVSHNTDKAFKCSLCQKKFLRKNELKSHIARAHAEVKVKHVSCSDCDKTFSKQSQANKHKAIHTKGELVTCQECGKMLSKGSLSYHSMVHSGEKPYVKKHFC